MNNLIKFINIYKSVNSFSNYLLNANIFPSISRSFSCSNNSALGAEGKGVGFDLNYFKICA